MSTSAGGTRCARPGVREDPGMTCEGSSVDPVVRTATEQDVEAVVALVESAYRGEASRAGWTTEADLLAGQRTDDEEVRALLAAEDSRILLLEVGGTLQACCHVQRRAGAEGVPSAYFGMFAVSPGTQGAGLGRLLLAQAEDRVRSWWGARSMEMTVLVQRPELVAWYERRGYTATGEARPFPYGELRFGRPLREDLSFVVLTRRLDGR